MHAALVRLQIKPKNQQINLYFNPTQQHSRISGGKNSLATTHGEKKTQVIILSRTQQKPLVNNTGTKEGKIAAYKKSNKKSAFDPKLPYVLFVKVLLVDELVDRSDLFVQLEIV